MRATTTEYVPRMMSWMNNTCSKRPGSRAEGSGFGGTVQVAIAVQNAVAAAHINKALNAVGESLLAPNINTKT